VKQRVDTALGLAIFALAAAGLFGLLAWRDVLRWTYPEPRPQRPWRIDWLVTAPEARATVLPKGARLEPSGRLTILEAPPSVGKPVPLVPNTVHWAQQPQPFDATPAGMKAGIRVLPNLRPIPPEELDGGLLVVGEPEYGGGRVTLVDGCFRLNGAGGPLLVMPPGSRLGLRDGWLVVGPPGLPPGQSARVGEPIFFEGRTLTNFDAGDAAMLRKLCGPGLVQSILPWSESVQVAQEDGFEATRRAEQQGISWDAAMRPIRACRAREAKGKLKPREHCRVPLSPAQPNTPPGQPPPPAPPRPVLR
jgi:hypothetical protein